MQINSALIISVLFILIIFSFVLGYLVGRLNGSQGVSYIGRVSKNSQQSINQLSKIDIDEKKFVVDINTNGLEKKYTELGETKQTQENISSAIDKLKNMKG
jgi:hypothetical protein